MKKRRSINLNIKKQLKKKPYKKAFFKKELEQKSNLE
jgi:hypothetical protein